MNKHDFRTLKKAYWESLGSGVYYYVDWFDLTPRTFVGVSKQRGRFVLRYQQDGLIGSLGHIYEYYAVPTPMNIQKGTTIKTYDGTEYIFMNMLKRPMRLSCLLPGTTKGRFYIEPQNVLEIDGKSIWKISGIKFDLMGAI